MDPPEGFSPADWENLGKTIIAAGGSAIITSADYYDVPITCGREIQLRHIDLSALRKADISQNARRNIEQLFGRPSIPVNACLGSPLLFSTLAASDLSLAGLEQTDVWKVLESWVLSLFPGQPAQRKSELAKAAELLGPSALIGFADGTPPISSNDATRLKNYGLLKREGSSTYFTHSFARAFLASAYVKGQAATDLGKVKTMIDRTPSYLRQTIETLVFCSLNPDQRVRLTGEAGWETRHLLTLFNSVPTLRPEEQAIVARLSESVVQRISEVHQQNGLLNRELWQDLVQDAAALGRFDPRVPDTPRASDFVDIPNRQGLLACFPVTNRQFEMFVKAGGYENPRYWSELGRRWRETNKISFPRFGNAR